MKNIIEDKLLDEVNKKGDYLKGKLLEINGVKYSILYYV